MKNKKLISRPMRPLIFPKQRLANSVDLRQWMPPIDNQHDMKTCCASAFAALCNYLFKRSMERQSNVSRLFIYYNGQMIQQRTLEVEDRGVFPQNIALGLRKYGVCEEKYWPYEKHLLNELPPDSVYERASRYTVIPLHMICDINTIETCLHNQLPVLIGIKLIQQNIQHNGGYLEVPTNLNDPLIKKTGIHGIMIVGYNRKTQYFICRNSYGENWGYHGYFYLPYDYLTHPRLIDHMRGLWSILKIIPRTTTLPTVRRLVVS
ncbi:unnamed protein product [Adineta steineri]|uniref:Peptidase C1A papain C-terminal domain-containing protein n=1 Tax=Adineta steineri TaxID=433720 RepID=A0A816AQ65_9BILA|nr:unnamed protein product [Adineta steineri]CAF1598475.1 unnamed protein product [Adineta steineri]